MPDCKCYKAIVESFLVESGICEEKTDIQMFDSGVCIAKRKVCGCEYDRIKETAMQRGEEDCKYWCDKLSLAGMAWCAKAFKRWDCQTACIYAVDLIKDGCHWCCDGGNFYKKCLKPFEDIGAYMDTSKCDPFWD